LASAILGGTTLFGAGIATLESVKGFVQYLMQH
jgi:hypothetical protein